MEITLVLGLLVLTLIILSLELLPVDVVALAALLVLVFSGILAPERAFASFGSEMMVLLASIFVIAAAMLRTGVLESASLFIYRHSRGSYRMLLGSIVLSVCFLSAFMNNTVVTAVFVPVIMAVARRAKLPPSRLLMPVAFASMLGGCCTLVGTSTNLAASGLMSRSGMEPFRLFEFLPVGGMLVVAGVVFFALLGDKLLPARAAGELTSDYHVKEYLAEVILRPGCAFIGKRVDEAGIRELADITVLGILRAKQALLVPGPREIFRAGDALLLEGTVESIQKLRQIRGVESKGDVALGDPNLESRTVRLVEVMIGPGSRFAGRTLKEIDFRRRYGMLVLAIHRQNRDLVEKVGRIPLNVGDLLLVQGPDARLDDLRVSANALILSDLSHYLLEKRKGGFVVGAFALALALGALQVLPLGAAVLGAALLTVLIRALPPEEAYRQIDWRLLMLIGSMTAFGQAMMLTGADRFLGGLILGIAAPLGVHGILAGFFLLTVALSMPLSNAAAALAVLPVALATAQALGVNPRTFAVVVTLAASTSFMTPFEPACILVYPAGRYRFADFVRVGGLLTLVVMLVVLGMVPLIWPL